MTNKEVIYCMKAYLPGNSIDYCMECPYYNSVKIDEQMSICKSSEAHELAIKNLEKLETINAIIHNTQEIQEDVIRYKMICGVMKND